MDAERTLHVRTGFFTLVVLVALAVMVGSLTREGGLFSERYTLYADFNNIEGLNINAPVHLAGNNVGRVRAIYFREPEAPHDLRVEMDVKASVASRIRGNSLASIRTIGLLGDKYVEITTGSGSARELADGDAVETIEPVNYDALAERGGELLDNLVRLSASADRIVGSFEEAMGTESIASTLGSLQRLVAEVEHGEGLAHALIYDADGSASVVELNLAMVEFRSALVRVNEILKQGSAPTLSALSESAVRLGSILEKIDSGQGTLGGLVNDPTLYEDIKLLMGGARDSALLRTLISLVKRDAPKR